MTPKSHLLSKPVEPVTLPLRLFIPSQKDRVTGLGCTKCLISPALMGRLGILLWKLKTPISFCQLDESVEGGKLDTFDMEPLEIAMGAHDKRFMFIVAPGMERPQVLGLTWLKWWNRRVDWKVGILRFQWGVTGPDNHGEELGKPQK